MIEVLAREPHWEEVGAFAGQWQGVSADLTLGADWYRRSSLGHDVRAHPAEYEGIWRTVVEACLSPSGCGLHSELVRMSVLFFADSATARELPVIRSLIRTPEIDTSFRYELLQTEARLRGVDPLLAAAEHLAVPLDAAMQRGLIEMLTVRATPANEARTVAALRAGAEATADPAAREPFLRAIARVARAREPQR